MTIPGLTNGPNTLPPAIHAKRTKAEQAAEPPKVECTAKGKAAKPAASQPARATQPANPVKGKPVHTLLPRQPPTAAGRWVDWDTRAALNLQRIGKGR
ncbi:hypothetical protein QJQ45_006138 [Haematococcus lacustris]|nr:hypothetical protein QJQ45_006138 [Haematococcus lacustris]